MEFRTGPDGKIVPNSEAETTDEHLARTQIAMDFFQINVERIKGLKDRAAELGLSGKNAVIALINVDDRVGGLLADILMPDQNWQPYRDAGQIPIARGLAPKEGIPEFLESHGYTVAASELSKTDNLLVLVLAAEVALTLEVDFTVDA